ncbi:MULTISPECIES: membrane protein insertase YidC [Leuconostoc]|uniref:Preprotein translocase YidC n=1 Tax=Leuconostoc pseudomesenteroides TaxID=33968 RepID=A0A1X0VC76_LEUPS|nr:MULTISPECIES: membrane protein insertase YidC [Leuconostoc]KDA48716.1 Inner membrane protein translocase component YidC, OxaA protein [Leuconostoc pseudomesenteroides 1159]KDA49666.1 Inner membrane protein translocase component YidC, OxaA protein [Leuconostoc pseudomesenteroides PS12]CCJ66232.1 Inner membrane protein translocase component YidC, OxaA protein [Leuconostoc pseudomesenteroides 4882]MCT4404167.1 membrane protein insertase YidC [Leuconostoc falkenbergense]MDG9745343.1 membrane pr
MKQLKRVLTIAFVILDIVLLTGGYDQNSRMYRWIGHPLAEVMTNIAHYIGGVDGIGWAIVIITAILRLILLPFFLNQQVNTTINQIKMQTLKPEIDKLQAISRKAGTPEEQQKASMSMMSLYRENDVSVMGGMSFLTMAMQLPVFSGLYSAILHAPALKGASFFNFDLGKPQLVFAIIAGIIYLAQAWLMMQHMPQEQRKTSAAMMFISPVMIFGFAMIASGAIGLYFVVGGIFALIQSLIQHLQRPGLEKRVAGEFKIKKTADDLMAEAAAKPANPSILNNTQAPGKPSQTNQSKKGRNAGKQKR